MSRELQVLSVYDGFFSGGARILHTDVVAGLHQQGQYHSVFSIHEEVEREATIQSMTNDHCYSTLVAADVPVSSLGRRMRTGQQPADFTQDEKNRLQYHIDRADIVLSLKEQPLGLINLVDTNKKPVIACLHRSDPENQGPALNALMDAISVGALTACVCCAESTKESYKRAGVPDSLLTVITNGIDLKKFIISSRQRKRVRSILRIPEDVPVVIFAARFDTMKNVPLFLKSARAYLSSEKKAHVIMCGAGMSYENISLHQAIKATFAHTPELADRLHILGIRSDMAALYAASDIVALTSAFGEAYPLCLIEGMACGAIPVATDVGDCAVIVSGRGIISPSDPGAIAGAWQEAYGRKAEFLAAIATSRQSFDRRHMIEAYGQLLSRVSKEIRTKAPLQLA